MRTFLPQRRLVERATLEYIQMRDRRPPSLHIFTTFRKENVKKTHLVILYRREILLLMKYINNSQQYKVCLQWGVEYYHPAFRVVPFALGFILI